MAWQSLISTVRSSVATVRVTDPRPPSGIDLIPAMQATIGLELAREHHPDLIILDLHLPDMPGADALQRLKEDQPDVPVIVLTADATEGVEQGVRRLGAADYLTKPLDVPQFLNILAASLNTDRNVQSP